MASRTGVKVDDDASADEHHRRTSVEGEAYAISALCSSRPANTRAQALAGVIGFLSSRSGPVGKKGFATVGSSLSSVVASSLDEHVPLEALVDAASRAAVSKLLPVVSKVLCILSGMKSMASLPTVDATNESDDEISDGSNDGNSDDDSSSSPGARKRKPAASHSPPRKKSKAGDPCSIGAFALPTNGTGQDYVDGFLCKVSAGFAPGKQGSLSPSSDSHGNDVFVATVSREAPLSPSAWVLVLENLLARLKRVDLFELPAFVYQLLLLVSTRGNAVAKRNVLLAVVNHFATLESEAKVAAVAASQAQGADEDDVILSRQASLSTIRQIESTTLVHIDFTVKQDPSLVSELTKLARTAADSPNSIMVPFGVAILLALSRSQSIQSNVLGNITDAIQRFEDELRVRSSSTFASQLCRDGEPLRSPGGSIMCLVECTSRDGWDLVSEPALRLGLLLLDKNVDPSSYLCNTSSKGPADLGSDILLRLFVLHPSLRTEIVDQLLSRILLREKSASRSVQTLSQISRQAPSDILECSLKIKESISSLVSLPPWISTQLIVAYKPLFRLRSDLRDFLFLALRKALFHREPSSRAVASLGFLAMICHVEWYTDLEVGSSQQSQCRSASVEFDEEAIQPLRRVLSHPPAIRALLYKESSKLIYSMPRSPQKDKFCNALHSLFQPHALQFVNAGDSPFLLLDRCVIEKADGRLKEPLGDLIGCLTFIQRTTSSSFSTEYLVDLARKVATVSVKDFDVRKDVLPASVDQDEPSDDVDQNCEPSNTSQGQEAQNAAAKANRNRGRVLGGVAEALLNVALSVEAAAHTTKLYVDTVFPLLQLREDVLDVLKHLGSASPTDAVRDLCGDCDIEPDGGTGYGLTGGFNDGSKPKRKGSGMGGKSNGADKRKRTMRGGDRSSSLSSDSVYKFGSFSILASSSRCPPVSLDNAVSCLGRIYDVSGQESEGCGGSAGPGRQLAMGAECVDWFKRNRSSGNSEKLSSYLFAVCRRHLESFLLNPPTCRFSTAVDKKSEVECLFSYVCTLAHAGMDDFEMHRSQTGAQEAKLAVRSLEVVETCANVVFGICGSDLDLASRFCCSLLRQKITCRSGDSQAKPEIGLIGDAVSRLLHMTRDLLECGLFKAAEVVVRLVRIILGTLKQASVRTSPVLVGCGKVLHEMSSWAQTEMEVCLLDGTQTSDNVSGIGDAVVVRGLASVGMIELDSKALSFAKQVAKRISSLLGSALEDKGSPPIKNEACGPFSLVTRANVLHVVDSVLDCVEGAVDDVRWSLDRAGSFDAVATLTRLNVSGGSGNSPRKSSYSAFDDARRLEELERKVMKAEDAAHRRMGQVMEILGVLMSSAVGKWSHQERLLKNSTRCYKLICISVAAQVRRRSDPRSTFIRVIETAKLLSPVVWDYAIFLNSDNPSTQRPGSSAAKEARLMPQLVYEIERFEKLLIAAAKKTKVNLLAGIKRNTARDYRITEQESASDRETAGQ